MYKVYKKFVVAFTGPSNSGKTTLIVKLSNHLRELGYQVAIIKHDPKDKAKFDTQGKDSYEFTNTLAKVAVISPKRTTLFKNNESTLDEIASMFGNFDYLFVEGLKSSPLPRIYVAREKLQDSYIKVSDAIALDSQITSKIIRNNIDRLDINNLNEIILWINNNAKIYKDK
jgi:molybdopterin-guanine dinucleotide biosynthesis protein B